MPEYEFSLTLTFPYKNRIFDSLFTRENKHQRKLIFWHILCTYKALVEGGIHMNKSDKKLHKGLYMTLSWWRSLSYRKQSIYLLCKLMDWFLYNRDLRHERVQGRQINNISLFEKFKLYRFVESCKFSTVLVNFK